MEAAWKKNPNRLINSATIIGDNARFNTSESFTATASQVLFTLVYQIVGNVRITVDGTEKTGGVTGSVGTLDYTYKKETKEVTFSIPSSTSPFALRAHPFIFSRFFAASLLP